MLSIESWEASSKLLIYSTQPNILPVLPFDGPENNLLGSRDTLLMEMMPVKQKEIISNNFKDKIVQTYCSVNVLITEFLWKKTPPS